MTLTMVLLVLIGLYWQWWVVGLVKEDLAVIVQLLTGRL